MKFINFFVATAIFATTSLCAFSTVFAQKFDGNFYPPPPHGNRMERGQRPPHIDHTDKLNLTDEQKAKATAIFQKANEDKKALLTDEQKAQIKAPDKREKPENRKLITEEQKAKFKDRNKDRNNVFTDEQKKHMDDMKANRHGHHPRMHKGNENFRGVELTEEQKTQFRAIDEKARKDFENILTDSQKKTLEEERANAKNRRYNDR